MKLSVPSSWFRQKSNCSCPACWCAGSQSKKFHTHQGSRARQQQRCVLGLEFTNGNSGPPWGSRGRCGATDQGVVLFEFLVHIRGLVPCSSPLVPYFEPHLFVLLVGVRSAICHCGRIRLATHHHFPVS